MSDDQQKTDASHDALEARYLESCRRIRLMVYQKAVMLAQLVDATTLASVEQTRALIARQAAENADGGNPLLDPYALCVLARHVPFDDWEDDLTELARQATLATADEGEALAAACNRPELEPWQDDDSGPSDSNLRARSLLLLDAKQRIIRALAGIGGDE
jgi:hypothetical protein